MSATMLRYEAAIFDLDGVIVDTAKYHYQAWKRLADTLGIPFTEEDNERLKGVSRMRSLDIILEIGDVSMGAEEKRLWAERKNEWYRACIATMDRSGLLAGAESYLRQVKAARLKTAIGSASKNAKTILKNTGIHDWFDAIVDGTMVENAKPDPEVFRKAAELLGVSPPHCVVFEDSQAGIAAAASLGMTTVGVGNAAVLQEADFIIAGLHEADKLGLVP